MEKIKIPRRNSDLQEYVHAQYKKFAIKYAICAAVILLAEAGFLFELVKNYRGTVNSVILAIILLIVPLFLFGGHKLIFDRSWEGKVLLLDYSTRREATGSTNIALQRYVSKFRPSTRIPTRTVTYCEVYVEAANGKTHTYTMRLAPEDPKLPIEVGTMLRKYRGLPYPVVIGNDKSECALCGRVNSTDANNCAGCGYSIIKTK